MSTRRHATGDSDFMQTLYERAAEAASNGELPFAAAIVRDGQLVSIETNLVRSMGDPTAHAEILAIRSAAEKLGAPTLTGCTLYCSCEPCPMCFGAAHFASITRIVYGATMGDAALAGFDQLPIFASQLKIMGRSTIEIVPEFQRERFSAQLTNQMS
jgi:tRNA(Arg) A34 adenosine deaminase TadA